MICIAMARRFLKSSEGPLAPGVSSPVTIGQLPEATRAIVQDIANKELLNCDSGYDHAVALLLALTDATLSHFMGHAHIVLLPNSSFSSI
jgi:hypothetical protein